MAELAKLSIEGEVAIVTLDNPPVNALAAPMRRAALAAIEQALEMPAARAIVLICAGRTFIAGADINELGKPLEQPSFEALFDRIEHADKPIIAAIHGTALGGGFELALVCHYRLATRSAKLGLPEVHLGILPGAGGTQRLPRLVGAEAALDMITSGRLVGATEAEALGLVDALGLDAELIESALAFARRVIAEGAARPHIRDREDRIAAYRARPDMFAAFTRDNARRFRGFKAPAAIVEAIEAAVSLPFDQGMAREKALFEHLVATPESAAQRHYFFAERGTARVPGIGKDVPLLDIGSVGVIGAGTMGGGIAMNFLNAGLHVTLVDTSQDALERGLGAIRRVYESAAQKGRMRPEEVDARMALLSPALAIDALADTDLVIEAVYESMVVKRQVFSALDRIAKPGAILATNTSFLDLEEIADATGRPEQVVGLHFFSPANVMRLVEVVRGSRTSRSVVTTAMKLASRIGKVPVLSGVCPGFIANRLLAPRGFQAEAMALEGTPIGEIDRVLFDYGFAMGHFQMMDLVGLDVIGRDAAERTAMGDLVAAGRLGQKSGAGYYDYDDKRRPSRSEVAERIIADVAVAKGIVRRETKGDEALLARLLYPVVNEGAKIIDEGIALRAADIDVAAILGYNWPVYTGGPMFWADRVGLDHIVSDLRKLEAEYGEAFRPSPLLERLAREGGTLSAMG